LILHIFNVYVYYILRSINGRNQIKGKKDRKIRIPKRKYKKEIWISEVLHLGKAPGEIVKLKLRKVVRDVARNGEMLHCWKI